MTNSWRSGWFVIQNLPKTDMFVDDYNADSNIPCLGSAALQMGGHLIICTLYSAERIKG